MEEILETIDTEELSEQTAQIPVVEKPSKRGKKVIEKTSDEEDELINCLRNEKITVKYILNEKTGITDRNHPFFGGLAQGAVINFVVPMLRNGSLKNPLTKAEKKYLEYIMGLDDNALSVYKAEDNYWDNYQVRLSKDDYILDLSTPKGYIDYKVLLANTDTVASSMDELNNNPKETYRFVLVSDKEVYDTTSTKVKMKEACMEAYFNIKDNFDALRCVIQTVTGRPVDAKTDINFLKNKCVEQIEVDPVRFAKILTDKLLPYKVLLNKAVDAKIVTKRGTWHMYEGQAMSDGSEEPTFSVAAKFLSNPKNQEIKFSIEKKLKD